MTPIRRLTLLAPVLLLLAACAGTPTRLPPGPPPVTLDNTAMHTVTDTGTGRSYPVWVDLPASYAQHPERRYPVLFTTDAQWAFPIIRGVRTLMGRGGKRFEDFILVGLPPQQGLSARDSRSRDYTPTDPRQRAGFDPRDYEAPLYGQAERWREVIEQQVFPLIASHYRADMQRKVYAGHSYGGLFGSYVLLSKPAMFEKYILGSPSFWFDQGHIFDIEAGYAARHDDLPAQVMMYIGGYEQPGEHPRSAGPGGKDMVGDVQRFAQVLRSRGYPGLQVGYDVVPEEDHGSVYPVFIARALVWALPGSDPQAGD